MNERADATWIARSREETLFGSLYHRHYRAIREFCRRRVPKDVVDDVVAETFLTAWRASTTYREASKVCSGCTASPTRDR